ncbi:hypothetical protein H6A18_08505 [Collinsella tanakaei]|uniref:hypothetical protein n=1 Tax=Collinsella tanakaei TaxID=626935 RepID=UPI0019580146|nr:hypothetical protein [Collinsella tanakaei]MBM6756546.1 hypothetical protein [Collinsella tanakaei]
MAKRRPLTADEATELFSELDDSGVVDPFRARDASRRRAVRDKARKEGGEEAVSQLEGDERRRSRRTHQKVDPLSMDDPSGSKVGEAITRTALICIIGVLVFVLGMQIVYGVGRRLNTANLSERTTVETVEHAMESGVEWGNGFTQFPEEFTVEEADERTGVVEVSVVDTTSKNELELLSNSQIQAAALATNALLNDKINRVMYNVFVRVDDDGNFVHDSFFGFIKGQGTQRAMLTFIWTKEIAAGTSNIDWELRIVGMDDETAAKIQEQVNSVSSLAESDELTQDDINEERAEQQLESALHGGEIFTGGDSEKSLDDVLPDADEASAGSAE